MALDALEVLEVGAACAYPLGTSSTIRWGYGVRIVVVLLALCSVRATVRHEHGQEPNRGCRSRHGPCRRRYSMAGTAAGN